MSMFHSGDLQSGISLAIQEQKLVACFVRADDDYWSELWESDWLANDESGEDASDSTTSIAETVKSKAILLRIEHGSQEAGFLSAFCPVEKVPTLVVIKNGIVVDKLEGGLERDEWAERLMRALGVGQDEQQRQAHAAQQHDATLESPQHSIEIPNESTTQAGSSDPPPEPSQAPAEIQTLLAERGQRLENSRIRREAQEKQERMARARAIREEAERTAAASDKGKQREASSPEQAKQKARVDWVQQQARRKREAAEEKHRILAQIEADKAERKRRDDARREAATSMAASPMPSSSATKPSATPVSRSTTCALQIRLFDGSSLKSRFASDATLSTAVRTWINENSPEGGADIPYNFRLLQIPNPSRTIGESEEGKPLVDVEGLMPTATLVLVPVQGYTEAYGSGGGIVGSAMGLASSAFGYVGSGLSYLTGMGRGSGGTGEGGLYMGGTSDESEESNIQGARLANADTGTGDGSLKPRVKTLADQRAEAAKKGENEFYNGNSLGFEGRKDDE